MQLHERFFRDTKRPPNYCKAISSRHFDAIAAKTCQIMQRGRFNYILDADKHYIAIEADFSNVEDAESRFKGAANVSTLSTRPTITL